MQRHFRGIGFFALALVLLMGASVSSAPAAAKGGSKSFQGKVRVRHTDDFKNRKSSTEPLLVSGSRTYPLLGDKAQRLGSGADVTVTGRLNSSGSIQVDRTSFTRKRARTAKRQLRAGTAPARRIAVLMATFQNQTAGFNFSAAQLNSTIFGPSASVKTFMNETTSGALNISGSVGGPYRLATNAPLDNNACKANFANWASLAKAQSGLDYSSYTTFIIVTPIQSACNYAGTTNLPGSESQATTSPYNVIHINGYNNVQYIAHELGHNLGLHHASALSCTSGGTTVSLSSNCTAQEYGDPFDVMGNTGPAPANANLGPTRLPNGYHRAQLATRGFTPTVATTISGSGTYTLTPAEPSSYGQSLLRIYRPGAPADESYYYLDYRQPVAGFDAFCTCDPVTKGISIRLGDGLGGAVPTQSQLIDASPDGNFLDSSLKPGYTYTDPIGISIRNNMMDPTGGVASVTINISTDHSAPSQPLMYRPTVINGDPNLRWTTSFDNKSVTGYRVYRDGSPVASTSATSYIDTNAPVGSHSYYVVAYDEAGNNSTPSNGRSVIVAPAEQIPVVTISSPHEGARANGDTTVTAVSTDNVRVRRMMVFIDGRRRGSRPGDSIAKLWRASSSYYRPGQHTIAVQAMDDDRNIGQDSITVTK